MIAGKEPDLQLSNPVIAFRLSQCRITGEMLLEPQLLKLAIVKGAEFRRAATEGPDEPQLHGDGVNCETESRLLRKHEAIAGFAFHFRERISRCQQVCVQVDATVGRKREVPDPVRDLERPMYEVAAAPDMLRP